MHDVRQRTENDRRNVKNGKERVGIRESMAAVNLSQSNYDNLAALFLISAAFAIAIVTLSLVTKIPIEPGEQPI